MPVKNTKILTVVEERELASEFFETTRYFPEREIPKDEHGMPIVAPEPDDPDDE